MKRILVALIALHLSGCALLPDGRDWRELDGAERAVFIGFGVFCAALAYAVVGEAMNGSDADTCTGCGRETPEFPPVTPCIGVGPGCTGF